MEMSPVQIINQPHPLIPSADRSFSAQDWRAGETARAALLRAGLDPHTKIVILVNDRTLTVAEWDTVCPQPGDLVHAVAAVSGGGDDGGSNPLKAVLTVAVMVAAFYAGPGLGGMMGGFGEGAVASSIGNAGLSLAAWQGIGSAAISLAGNAVLGAVFKSSSGSLSAVNGTSTTSASTPTYSLSGGSNSIRQYAPMQVVMGQHRVFPDYGSKPYTELHGDDQYLYQIFNFGLSSLQITDLKIGDSPISNYADISLCWSDANGNLPGFPGNVDTTEGASLVRGEDWIVRTSAADTTRIAVDIEGTCYYTGDAGLLPCTVRVEAQYRPAGGSWAPMMYGTDVTYTTGYWSLQTTEIDTSNDQYITRTIQHAYAKTGHYEGETQLVRSWVEYGDSGPVVHDIYGTWRWASFSSGFASDGPQPIYTTVDHVNIAHGASQTPQRHTFAIDVASGVYDVRVRLTSAASSQGEIAVGDSRGGYTYSFSALRSYQEDTASYTGQTRLGMVIRASGQLSGTISKLSAMASAYTWAVIGGEWRWVPTSNPAWWYLDFARGRKNSKGEKLYGCHLSDDQIDIDGIVAWAAFCDAEGLTLGLVLDTQQSSSDTLNDIARCGLASPSRATGKQGVVWDKRNASPVAAFGMSNIIKGSFSVKYVTENLADEIVVSYIDKDQGWEQKQVRVTIPGVTNPQRTSTLELKGCTNAAMAWKYANIQAAAQVYRRRTITWDADMEGTVCQRGDVVLLQHDLTQWGYSGRLVAVGGTLITLDRQVPRSGAAEYVMIVSPNGSMQKWQIAAGSGDSDTLTLPEAPELQDGVPTIDHRWFFSPLSTPGKLVKLVSVRPVSAYRVQIVATDEYPELYSAWDGVFTPPAQQTLLRNTVPTITGMDISETLVLVGSVVTNRVTVTFSVSDKFDSIFVTYRVGGGAWVRKSINSGDLVFDTDQTGSLEIEANAIQGVSLSKRYNGRGLIAGKTSRPGDVSGFAISVTGGLALLTVDLSTELDVTVGGRLRVRHSSALTGAKWDNAADLIETAPTSVVVVPLMAGTYLAKWVDSGGRDSVNAALIESEITSYITDLNVVAELNDAPVWPGVRSGVWLDSVLNGIKLDSRLTFDEMLDPIDSWGELETIGGVSSSGTYILDSDIDLGRVVTSRLTSNLLFETFDGEDKIDARLDNIDDWPDFDGADLSLAQAYLETRMSDDLVSWSEWSRFSAGEFSFRALQARLRLMSSSSSMNVVVRAASVRIDMPDRVESGADILASDGECVITYATPFMIPPSLAIAAQGMQTGDYYRVTPKDEHGFTIRFYNSSGTLVSRTFDYIAKGY